MIYNILQLNFLHKDYLLKSLLIMKLANENLREHDSERDVIIISQPIYPKLIVFTIPMILAH